ncbi:DNA translocase FtsK, partial [bacterium]
GSWFPTMAATSFIINKNDQLEIPIIESMPHKPANPHPAAIKPATEEEAGEEFPVAIEIQEKEWPDYVLPSTGLLTPVQDDNSQQDKKEILANAKLLEETLGNFGIEAKVVQISRGPAITRYELQPSPGVKVSRIVSLSDDIALNLAAQQVRIVAPIPGKAAVGIEVPNKSISMVTLREVLESEGIQEAESKLAFSLGKDISGKPIVADLAKMPHLLVAGATGSGKSVCINTIISSILFRARPDEVKFLMIDPKVVELNIYNGIPHLILPVVTDPKKASIALNWAVQEMTDRYKLFAEAGVRDITGYNRKLTASGQGTGMPKIVVIIDELADLMMVAPNAVEDAICRLAQMARAAGIHLIVATQRPSVDVITGVIKANVPSRIAFAVSSMMDSRTIIDMGGAE